MKEEIQEWKDICTEKEKEMRQIRSNNKASKKSVGFQNKNEETTYDEDRPVRELHGASKSFMNVAVGTDFENLREEIERANPNRSVLKSSSTN
jgi:hypothetical protein